MSKWDGTPHTQSCVECYHAGRVELGKVYCTKYGWEIEPSYDPEGRVIGFTEADKCPFFRRSKA